MGISQSEKAKQFRALHDGPETFVIPNPWDAGSARMLESLRFKALATTSAGLAFSLGRRDGERLVSREEVLTHIRAVVGASDLPVAGDLENGFGDDAKTVAETIRFVAEAGLVGGSIEDASGDCDDPIYEFNHAVERVAAAVEAAGALPFPFTLTGRAENFLHERPDIDDTIRRLQAFAKVGAHVVYAPGLRNVEEIKTVCTAVAPTPVNALVSAGGPTAAEFAAAGVRRVSLGSGLARMAYSAFFSAAREIKEHGSFNFATGGLSFSELNSFMRGRSPGR
jgi:2-methylisocitrate lyase-like PEP mutase family enzyme